MTSKLPRNLAPTLTVLAALLAAVLPAGTVQAGTSCTAWNTTGGPTLHCNFTCNIGEHVYVEAYGPAPTVVGTCGGAVATCTGNGCTDTSLLGAFGPVAVMAGDCDGAGGLHWITCWAA